MKTGGVLFRRAVTLSLFRTGMDQDCFIHPFGVLNCPHHIPDVMPVDRSQVSDPHLLKKHSREHE